LRRKIVNHRGASLLLRVLLSLASFALIALVFYIYHEGTWHNIYLYYRYFFDPKRLRLFIESFGPYAAFVFILTQILQVLVAPIPGEITGFVGGYLFGIVNGTLLSTVGLMAGSLIAFGITRRYGLKYVEKVVKKHYIDKFNHFITHKGLYLTFVFFLIPGFPKDSLCYLLGLTHIGFLDFLFMNLFGRLPGTLLLTLQGAAVKNHRYKEFLILVILSIAVTFVLYLLRGRIVGAFSRLIHSVIGKKGDHKR
jgi:uncharacterized membrane protein YdjX (TVP38/TMEM64 family)